MTFIIANDACKVNLGILGLDYTIATKNSEMTSENGSPKIGDKLNGKNNAQNTESEPKTNKLSREEIITCLKDASERYKEEFRKKTDNLKASNGMTYKDAKAKMEEIESKYPKGKFFNPGEYYKVRVHEETGKNGVFLSKVTLVFDPSALPDKERDEYLMAKVAVEEIEQNNKALFAQFPIKC